MAIDAAVIEDAVDLVRSVADRLAIVVVSLSRANTGTVYMRCRTAQGVAFALRLSDHPMPPARVNPRIWSASVGVRKSLKRLCHFMHAISRRPPDAAGSGPRQASQCEG